MQFTRNFYIYSLKYTQSDIYIFLNRSVPKNSLELPTIKSSRYLDVSIEFLLNLLF